MCGMTREQHLATVAATYAAFGAGDIPTVLDNFDPAVEWVNQGPDGIEYFGTKHGHEGALAVFGFLGANVDISVFDPHTFVADDERVVALVHVVGTVRSTGTTYLLGARRQGAEAGVLTLQDLILKLSDYWAAQGCLIQQPLDIEIGAGTMHPETFLRVLGPQPWNVAYVQPSRRPADGRFGENPNRLFKHHQFQVILKPAPDDVQDLYLQSLEACGIDLRAHDVRFEEDNWESPTLGAWGIGWQVLLRRPRDHAVHLLPAGRRAWTCRRSPSSSPTGSSDSRWRCRVSTTSTICSGRRV